MKCSKPEVAPCQADPRIAAVGPMAGCSITSLFRIQMRSRDTALLGRQLPRCRAGHPLRETVRTKPARAENVRSCARCGSILLFVAVTEPKSLDFDLHTPDDISCRKVAPPSPRLRLSYAVQSMHRTISCAAIFAYRVCSSWGKCSWYVCFQYVCWCGGRVGTSVRRQFGSHHRRRGHRLSWRRQDPPSGPRCARNRSGLP